MITDSIIMLSVIRGTPFPGRGILFVNGRQTGSTNPTSDRDRQAEPCRAGRPAARKPFHTVQRLRFAGCQCKATPPKKHGPYYQVSFTRKGKSSSKFVRKEDLPAIRKQLKNYERMKLLVDRWIDLATELSNLQIKQNRN